MIKQTLFNIFISTFLDKRARKKLIHTKKKSNSKHCGENIDSRDLFSRKLSQTKKRENNHYHDILVKQAIAIHRDKRHIVDELPKEQRDKLIFMALKLFGESEKKNKLDQK